MLSGLRRKLSRCTAGRRKGAASERANTAARPAHTAAVPAWDSPGGAVDEQLHVLVERRGSALLVHAGGSVDASNVALWRRLVGEAAAVATAPGPLIIDTSGLEFMAICAFPVLVEESAACRGRGIRLCVVSDQRIVARVLAATGLDGELALAGSVDDVLGGARNDPGPLLDS
ncbi:hypothetical protein A5735_18625 [Mycolicibacter heraklionensis]|nr:hypothetical protein A5735_18625 [Mycolicibacter heraklionensis]